MDFAALMRAYRGEEAPMAMPPGAYGTAQYAPNAGIGDMPRGAPARLAQPGLLQQLQGMLTPDFTPSKAQQQKIAEAVKKRQAEEAKRRKMQEQAMKEYITQGMAQQQAGAPVMDAPQLAVPPAAQRLQGLGVGGDMRLWQALQQAGVE